MSVCLMAFSSSSSSSSPLFIFLQKSLNDFRTHNLKNSITCSYQTIEIDNQQPHNLKLAFIPPKKKKTKQKLKPSFHDQVREKWSLKIDSQRQKFPWQDQEDKEEYQKQEKEEEKEQHLSQFCEENGRTTLVNDPVSFSLGTNLSSPPWLTRGNLRKPQFTSESEFEQKGSILDDEEMSEFHEESENLEAESDGYSEEEHRTETISTSFVSISESPFGLKEEKMTDFDEEFDGFSQDVISVGNASSENNSVELPWESKSSLKSVDRSTRRSKSEFAEKTIPENELKRLRNVSLRMKERIKVRAGGVTQALVDKINENWKGEEVVKLKFEGAPAFNMKRTHETLEKRTGGLVIWRSGNTLVLYRGMAYKLPCVQHYTKLSQANGNDPDSSSNSIADVNKNVGLSGAAETEKLQGTGAAKLSKNSSDELMGMDDLNKLLDELGPRFLDWSGPEPLPIDADLLPPVVPGYTTPFRVLPYRVRSGLGNKRMTTYRRLARISPPHFALGRNRELQGLAMAMAKLWERNAIAKIAIKRGVLNTRNERMAEELKRLTGGTLLSRNKEYIVFYRGNDFMPPPVTEALLERQKLVEVQQEEEEIARDRASLFVSKAKGAKVPLVAGTLAETLAAKSRWGNEPSREDLEKMKKDLTQVKHAASVRYLEKKLARAQDKVNKAEKALRKVQEFLNPAELPSDLETITDEERVLFRRMGLSMKAFLVVGRREVFDGTVENMHLHWKHRELVKLIVRGSTFPQVKHIAISLEAESGGLLVSVDKTTQGYAIVVYRGKNYQRPQVIKPKNLLTKRQALARSIELQRREGLIHHISEVRERIELLKSGLDQIEAGKEADHELHTKLHGYFSDDDLEDEGEEAYLETYKDDNIPVKKPANGNLTSRSNNHYSSKF